MKNLEFKNGKYRSKSKATWCRKISPSFFTYIEILSIIYRASHRFKRTFSYEEWTQYSFDVLNSMEKAGVQFEIDGYQNVKDISGPCVYVSNHMSILETFLLPGLILPVKPVTFVVKKSLTEFPFFRHIMRATNAIAVGRKNPRADLKTVLEEGMKRLNSGISVVIFPQTTRTIDFSPEKFNTIGIKLAKRTQSPVIPIAVKTDAWGTGKVIRDFGKIDPEKKVHISFGPKILIEDRGSNSHQKVVDYIQNKLSIWKDQ